MPGKETDEAVVEWVTAREGMNLLGWTNPESIRQLRIRGKVRFQKRLNGRVLYKRSDLMDYRDRLVTQGAEPENPAATAVPA